MVLNLLINSIKGMKTKKTFLIFQRLLCITDLRFFKTPRAIRTPFRNTEIMTARGFGKRNDENTQSNYGRENEIESKKN
jgi:hypothetical protein